jgi:hypothetical protein
MGDDKLPAQRPDGGHDIAKGPEGTLRAKNTRDPITGFFHNLGSRIARRSLEHDTAETQAFEKNLDAHAGAIKGIMRLRDTVDDYKARDELAPEYYEDAVGRHRDKLDENRHQRALAAQRRAQEGVNADIAGKTTRLNLLKAAREAEFQHAVSRDGVRNFKQSDTVRQQFRDEVMAAKVSKAKAEREAQSERPQGSPSSLSEADRAYIETLETLRESAYARGDHEEAARIMTRIAIVRGDAS